MGQTFETFRCAYLLQSWEQETEIEMGEREREKTETKITALS